jgi:hypothetical protein
MQGLERQAPAQQAASATNPNERLLAALRRLEPSLREVLIVS